MITTSRGSVAAASLVLVDVFTSDGVTGSAYVSVYMPSALKGLAALINDMKPLVEDRLLQPQQISRGLADAFRLDSQLGLVGAAISSIDMAVWDAFSRQQTLPLATLLGGDANIPIPAYASLVGWTASELVLAAEDAVRSGFSAVKAKIGHPTLADDLHVVRELRAAVGDHVALMVDYNQALQVDDAIARCAALRDEGVTWVEEPIRHDDHPGNARVGLTTNTKIQLGENFWSSDSVRDSIAARSSDFIMLDVMRIGGVSGWLTAAREAKSVGKPVSSHVFIEYSSHLLAATPTRHWLEWLDRAGPLLAEGTPTLSEGSVLPVASCGSGILWDEDAVRHYGVE